MRNIVKEFKTHIAFYRALYEDKRTPSISKALLWLAIAYFLSPIDLIPDAIPVLGQLDDLLIVPSLLLLARLFIPKSLYEEVKKKAFSVRNPEVSS